jgi:chromate reductase, NAD(P)H dehydrogenase (quinone)
MHQVAVIVGSLRRESLNRAFARALAKLAEKAATPVLELKVLELGDVPLYNEELWQSPPEGVTRLKREIDAAAAVLFVTPEYNRSMPAVTKNTLDWASRPLARNCWAGKPVAVVGTSPGAIGTAVAQSQLRSSLVVCGAHVLGQPEVYFVSKPGLITESFDVSDDKSRAFLEGFLAKFAAHIGQHVGA